MARAVYHDDPTHIGWSFGRTYAVAKYDVDDEEKSTPKEYGNYPTVAESSRPIFSDECVTYFEEVGIDVGAAIADLDYALRLKCLNKLRAVALAKVGVAETPVKMIKDAIQAECDRVGDLATLKQLTIMLCSPDAPTLRRKWAKYQADKGE